VREQQLTGILRNYDQLKQDYNRPAEQGKPVQDGGADLGETAGGPNSSGWLISQGLPTIPSSPNRIKVSLGGRVAGGDWLGDWVLAFLMEFRDRSSYVLEKDLGQRFCADP